MALFTLENVNYKNILRYPNLEIVENCATFICGESGSGKSTLLKLLNGVISPTSGVITYAGKYVDDYDPIVLRREVLLVSQGVYLFDMTIQENFDEYYRYRDKEPISEQEMKFYLAICAVDLPLESSCNVLSGGERQRIFTAIHLSFGAKVLMLDEPTSALDNKSAATFMENVKFYCQQNKLALLVVSHDRSVVDQYADVVINLEGGAMHE